MNRNADLDLRVYAVGYSMRDSDSPEAFSPAQERLPDPRVTESEGVGCGYLDGVPTGNKGPVQWAAFYLYYKDAVWEEEPTQLLAAGRTILDDQRKWAGAIASLEGSKASDERD